MPDPNGYCGGLRKVYNKKCKRSLVFENDDKLGVYLYRHLDNEDRDREYKDGVEWASLRMKIVKTALSMANLEGGGYIIIGIKERKYEPRPYEIVGLSEVNARTYAQDDVCALIDKYADPHVRVELKHFTVDEKRLVVIEVHAFNQIPVICKKTFNENKSDTVERGRIYYRPAGRIESTACLIPEDLREIIGRAADMMYQNKMKDNKLREGYAMDQRNEYSGEWGAFD